MNSYLITATRSNQLEELNQRAENRTNVLHLAINLASAVAVGDRNLNPHCKSLTSWPYSRSTAFSDPNYSSHVRFAQSDVRHPGIPSEILVKNLFKGWGSDPGIQDETLERFLLLDSTNWGGTPSGAPDYANSEP
jgi:hypothetical protein